ncbi:MAG TPA: hypothetical protein VMJ66_15625 [Geobacteraceae bacterium]|nr:hypothetical protein [Geobacteraceae bacterium]
MGSEDVELTGSECPECGEDKLVAVAISSICRECGLDSLFLKYEIPGDKVRDVLADIFRVLDRNGLRPMDGVTGINNFEELEKRLNK